MRRDRVKNRWERSKGFDQGDSPLGQMQPKKQINGILVKEMKKEAFDNGEHWIRWAEKTKED